MFTRKYLEEANKGNWDLEKVWERCVAIKEKNGPTVFYALESSYRQVRPVKRKGKEGKLKNPSFLFCLDYYFEFLTISLSPTLHILGDGMNFEI